MDDASEKNNTESEDDIDLIPPPPNPQRINPSLTNYQQTFITSAFERLSKTERRAVLEMPLWNVVDGLKSLVSKKQKEV